MVPPRFFLPSALTQDAIGQTIELPAAAAHHAVRVVRLAVGDTLTLFDGAGGEYAATLLHVERKDVGVRIDSFDAVERESPLSVTLAQAIAANDAMDYAVRKAVELGVTALQPLVTERSAPLPSGERGDKRLAHWKGIAVAACEQCGRNRIPLVSPPAPWKEWLASWKGAGVVLVPGSASSLAALPRPTPPVALAIGPEGGFTDREIGAARAAGWHAVSFGPRVLRTETAAAAALALMQALWGDLR
ncbi:MAG: 16S rRNA (uracil(1498)-N(3))-methyltransferase [Casimicrobiaceae bacterium]